MQIFSIFYQRSSNVLRYALFTPFVMCSFSLDSSVNYQSKAFRFNYIFDIRQMINITVDDVHTFGIHVKVEHL